MRQHPDELADAEHRERPRRAAFHQVAQTCQRDLVQWHLGPMRIDEHVGIDRDHRRSSSRS
jgi:hypothetical protein